MKTVEPHREYVPDRPSRLGIIRRLAGLSQRSVAQAAGVSRETVCLIENGRQRPRARTAEAIAAALGYDDPAQVFPPEGAP